MFRREKLNPARLEHNSGVLHPEHQSVNTSVSEYLIKYGSGKIDSMPTDTRTEFNDDRSDEVKLKEGDDFPLGTEELDVLEKLNSMADRLEEINTEVELSKTEKSKFDKAVAVLKDDNSSYEAKSDAYRILRELESKGKVSFS